MKGGLYGKHPNLAQLSDGDLAHTVDFRSVYADILSGWLGVDDPRPIVGGDFPRIGIVGA